MLVADLPVQELFVETLHSGFANIVGACVVHRVNSLKFLTVDTPDVPQGMGRQLTMGVVPNQFRGYLNPRQFVAVNRQARDFLFIQIVTQGQFLERTARLKQPTLEALHIFLGNTQHALEFCEGLFHVADTLRYQRHTENRAVLGQQDIVAVIDQPAGRRHGLYLNTVFVGKRGVDVVFYNLQLIHPGNQHAQQYKDQ